MVTLREALLSFDTAKDDTERDQALSTLRNHAYWNHDHQRPNNLKKIKNLEEAKGGDTSEEEDEALKGFKTEFNSETHFTRGRLTDNFMASNS